MKKVITAFSLLLMTGTSYAQMVLEKTYTNATGQFALYPEVNSTTIFNLSVSGRKYAVYYLDDNNGNFQLNLYNMNHTIWKSITLPQFGNYKPISIYHIAENLFTLDGKLCLSISYSDYGPNHPATDYRIYIIDENGNVISQTQGYTIRIYNVGNDVFKAIVKGDNIGQVYSLPGKLPCDPCDGATNIMGINNDGNASSIEAIPNPNNGQVIINYSLPDGIKQGTIVIYNSNGQLVQEYKVSNTRSSISLTGDLLPGVYYYKLNEGNSAKKMIVIQ